MAPPIKLELYEKTADNGSIITVIPLTFGRARVTIALHDPMWYDDAW